MKLQPRQLLKIFASQPNRIVKTFAARYKQALKIFRIKYVRLALTWTQNLQTLKKVYLSSYYCFLWPAAGIVIATTKLLPI